MSDISLSPTRMPILIAGTRRRAMEGLWTAIEACGHTAAVAEDETALADALARHGACLIVCVLDDAAVLRRVIEAAPGVPVVAATEAPSVAEAVEAMRLGASDYQSAAALVGTMAATLRRFARCEIAPQAGGPVAVDQRMRATLALAHRVAPGALTVMITGESGSGKEVIARAIHNASDRAAGPFVAVNCAAIPENLLEATLFGYEKGAYTGAAAAQPGKFELASGGTLLLDEVTEMPLALQAKLLRALQEREIERVGGRGPIAVDTRVIATSNRALEQALVERVLREDLYYRLNVFPIAVPPLRERPLDIVPLAERFAAGRGGAPHEIAACARRALLAHRWPGNVRELANAIQRALVLAPGRAIEAQHLGLPAAAAPQQPVAAKPVMLATDAAGALDMKTLERIHILETLEAVGGSRKRAVEILGISERTLRHKLRQYRQSEMN